VSEKPKENLKIRVYRPYDYPEFESYDPPDSPRALESHYQRRDALLDVLGGVDGWKVKDWGDTDDSEAHEYVELILAVLENPQFQTIAVLALTNIGNILATAAVQTAVSEAVKNLIARLSTKQKQKKIAAYYITLPEGHSIHCDPKVEDAAITHVTITVTLQDGKRDSVQYSATDEDGASQRHGHAPQQRTPEL
jgi:hypothetical protein